MWSWILLLWVHVVSTAWQDGLPIPIAIRRGEKIDIIFSSFKYKVRFVAENQLSAGKCFDHGFCRAYGRVSYQPMQ